MKPFWSREKALRSWKKQWTIFNFLYQKSKFVSFGIEPLVAYLIAKENEIKLVRIS